MSKKYYQVFPYILLFLLIVPFLIYDPIHYNYTGILSKNKIFAYICLIPNIFYYSYLYCQNKPVYIHQQKWSIYCLALCLCMFLTCIIPYAKDTPVISNFHLLFGVISLVLLVIGLFLMYAFETKRRNILFLLLILDLIYITSCMSINGLSELYFVLVLFFATKKER